MTSRSVVAADFPEDLGMVTDVVIEAGARRVFASALDWPGWSRSGRSRDEALEALLAYAPRYRAVVGRRRLGFEAPADVRDFRIAEEIPGNASTNFGIPAIAAKSEAGLPDAAELKRLLMVLSGCWDTLAKAVETAGDRELQKGPRGGGRSTTKMIEHVFGGHEAYLRQIACREKLSARPSLAEAVNTTRAIDAKALAFAASGEMPERGPRGGQLWTPRYFVRRAAWHILDHAWEIEDRIVR